MSDLIEIYNQKGMQAALQELGSQHIWNEYKPFLIGLAKRVLVVYEEGNPDDSNPRKHIENAIKSNSEILDTSNAHVSYINASGRAQLAIIASKKNPSVMELKDEVNRLSMIRSASECILFINHPLACVSAATARILDNSQVEDEFRKLLPALTNGFRS